MSKSVKRLKTLKNVAEKIEHSIWMKTNVPAGLASAAPPLGSMLGQRSINIANFCKDFNERTANTKKGIPLPIRVKLHADRSYTLIINQPPVSYFLKQAAGISHGAMEPGREVAGKVTLKHVYEIAKIKMQDQSLQNMSLQTMCNAVISTARTVGVKIVKDLDEEEYRQFLEERKLVVEEQKRELLEKKEAKMLRMT